MAYTSSFFFFLCPELPPFFSCCYVCFARTNRKKRNSIGSEMKHSRRARALFNWEDVDKICYQRLQYCYCIILGSKESSSRMSLRGFSCGSVFISRRSGRNIHRTDAVMDKQEDSGRYCIDQADDVFQYSICSVFLQAAVIRHYIQAYSGTEAVGRHSGICKKTECLSTYVTV